MYKEGTNLKLGCKAVGGIPDKVDGFVWMIRNEQRFMDFQVDYSHNSSVENGGKMQGGNKSDFDLQ